MSTAVVLSRFGRAPPTKYIPLDDLVIENERVEVDPQAMEGLIQSIGALGLLQPIIVVKTQHRRHGADALIDTYHVVAGRRRIRAVRALGWNAIQATDPRAGRRLAQNGDDFREPPSPRTFHVRAGRGDAGVHGALPRSSIPTGPIRSGAAGTPNSSTRRSSPPPRTRSIPSWRRPRRSVWIKSW